MKKYFITGNTNKFNEIKMYIPDLIQEDYTDAIEVQSLELEYVIEKKLEDAKNNAGLNEGIIITEDTGLYLNALNNFPGPLIKFMLESVKPEGIFEICNLKGNFSAYAKTIFGVYNTSLKEFQYFEGIVEGKITSLKGTYGFGWDTIFIPDGANKTFAEMSSIEEKNKYSMRYLALKKLLKFLNK